MLDESHLPRSPDSIVPPPTPRKFGKLVILATLVALVGAAFWILGDRLSLPYLAAQETTLREYHKSSPLRVALVAIAIYLAVAGFSLPGATVLTLAYGWYFGFWQGLLVVSFGSTGGAMIAFLLTRYFLQDWVQHRFAHRLETINAAFDREGAFYLFTLRLIPAVPFFVINAVMGLTKIRGTTFWWVSQLGMLPGTAAYVYAGASVPSLQQLANEGIGKVISWQLLLAFAILGALPLVVKRIVTLLPKYRGIQSSKVVSHTSKSQGEPPHASS
jgi:uncharacterized membrane protein YdjX (TVP38/TMEM64 family)